MITIALMTRHTQAVRELLEQSADLQASTQPLGLKGLDGFKYGWNLNMIKLVIEYPDFDP